jgi:protease IV
VSLEIDLLLDRRRLKRRLVLWRVVAVLAVVAAVLLAIDRGGVPVLPGQGAHVAVLRVNGIIADDPARDAAVERLASEHAVKALVITIDSPGGSVAGGEALHDAIAHVATTKPVVVVMGALAASAGYMIALPANRIFAREGTLTGSIGVLLEAGEVSGLMRKLGITSETIVSGPLKDQPSLTAPLSPEGRIVLQGLVDNLYQQFVAMVATGRHMSLDGVKALADGRAYTGQQALKLGLIDAIGGMRAARAWLASAKGVPASLSAVPVAGPGFASRAFGASFGGLLKVFLSQRVNLDGAWAIWQPAAPLR